MTDKHEEAPISRDGLISVPLATRPKSNEMPKHLSAFQSHAIDVSLKLIKEVEGQKSNALSPSDLISILQRLITALSTDLEYVRIPVVWAMCNKLIHFTDNKRDQLLDEMVEPLDELTNTVGIFLSHFDLALHLTEAERRVAIGDDKIDEALFVELEELVEEFDETRAKIFSDAAERTSRIGAVLALPRGVVPEVTVMAYKSLNRLATNLDTVFGYTFKAVGTALGVYSILSLSGLASTPWVQSLFSFLGRLL